jgi:hypothetical protein
MQKYLLSTVCQYEMSASAAGKKKEPLSRIFLVNDHRRSKKLPMGGLRKNGIELGFLQSRKKPGAEIAGK